MIAGTTVIDFHGHVGKQNCMGLIDDPDEMLRAMDAVGIDKSCVFNIFHPDGQHRKRPDRPLRGPTIPIASSASPTCLR